MSHLTLAFLLAVAVAVTGRPDAPVLGVAPKFSSSKFAAVPRFPSFPSFSDAPKFVAPTLGLSKVVGLVHKDEVRDEAGQFSLRFQSEDGITVSEVGKLVPNAQGDDNVLVKEGSYTFTSPEGQTYTVNYVADENGYRPTGGHF